MKNRKVRKRPASRRVLSYSRQFFRWALMEKYLKKHKPSALQPGWGVVVESGNVSALAAVAEDPAFMIQEEAMKEAFCVSLYDDFDFGVQFLAWYRREIGTEPPARRWLFDHFEEHPEFTAGEIALEIKRLYNETVTIQAVNWAKFELRRMGAEILESVN
jgi:hypothetical protein